MKMVWLGAALLFLFTSHAQADPLIDALREIAANNQVSVSELGVDSRARQVEQQFLGAPVIHGYLMDEPHRVPAVMGALANQLTTQPTVASVGLEMERLLFGHRAEPAAKVGSERLATTVEEAIEDLFQGTGDRFQGRQRDQFERDLKELEPYEEVLQGVVPILQSLKALSDTRNQWQERGPFPRGGSFDHKTRETQELLWKSLNGGARTVPGSWPDPEKAPELVKSLLSPGWAGIREIEEASLMLAELVVASPGEFADGPASEFEYVWSTPRGRVALGGSGVNTYEGEYLLVVDLGGDDAYRGAGAVSGGRLAASVVVDVSGADTYAYKDSSRCGPGGAVLGFAGVFDFAGDDIYQCGAWGGGFGCLGIGWIRDRAGTDKYSFAHMGQGAGLCGVGLLIDESGDDRYHLEDNFAWEVPRSGLGQGYGAPMGAGVLIDLEGDDHYAPRLQMDCEVPQVFSRKLKAHHIQGAANGYGPWAGGVGLLIDGQGDDLYAANSGLGWGSRQGLGVVVDRSGQDQYFGEHGVMGYGSAQGLGAFLELEGHDSYCNLKREAFGRGENLGLGLFLDREGHDRYSSHRDCFGTAQSHGAGWFFDLSGRDEYAITKDVGFGHAQARSGKSYLLAEVPTSAVFVDLGGELELSKNKTVFDSRQGFLPVRGNGAILGGTWLGPTDSKER